MMEYREMGLEFGSHYTLLLACLGRPLDESRSHWSGERSFVLILDNYGNESLIDLNL